MGWEWPQIGMALFIGMGFVAIPFVHGKPRSDPNFNGWATAFECTLVAFLLYAGGFWT